MPISVHDRLKIGAAILEALDCRRARANDPRAHAAVERKIVDRELDELAWESAVNPAPSESRETPKTPSLVRAFRKDELSGSGSSTANPGDRNA